ncbi:MAG: acyltransferase family protein, partial [Anaerolineaceae bacterium]|nr:acyltransferase family protein [Anaerolineaceae bacterium]
AFTQAYFMGILFLVAGYFIPGAYDKKGFRRFINDRFVRLGIPSLIYMLVIHPFITYTLLDLSWVRPKPGLWNFYASYITSLDFLDSSGPLWFALALLIFSLVYACFRSLSSQKTRPAGNQKITDLQVILLILLITAVAFSIRLVQPIGTSVLNMQLCYFAQYIILFAIGIQAHRRGWLANISTRFGMKWLRLGLIGSPLIFLGVIIGGGAMENGLDFFYGGWHWQNAAYALWESFTGVAMSIGLLTLFREKYSQQNRLVKILSDNSFAAYVFHAPVLISISLLLQSLALPPLAKFALVAALTIPATFALTFFILRRIPLLKKVI